MGKVILEGNKLISTFMGLYHPETEDVQEHWVYPEGKQMYSFDNATLDANNLQYHNSWDWLMPVVEKINKTGGGCININGDETFLHYGDISFVRHTIDKKKSKIQTVWLSCVEFITWFNSLPSPAATLADYEAFNRKGEVKLK